MEKKNHIVLRFGIIYFGILLCFIAIIAKIIIIQTVERNNWLELAQGQIKTNITVKPNRGNIYSSDGSLMASSIPMYYIYMDTRVPALHENDGELFYEYIDTLSTTLSSYFGDRSAAEYKRTITQAYKQGNGNLRLYPKRITFAQLKEVKQFPLFNKGRYKSGLITREQTRRVKPFGSLASRTIGDIYADEAKGGRSGLELYFNKQLTGTPGVATRQKAANQYVDIIEVEPQDGCDIITTIDIGLQDIAEEALLNELHRINAHSGYVVMMETHSGEVKAIVNLVRNDSDGNYYEARNGVVSDMAEPGSTFKTASLMAAIDDGFVNIWDSIDVGTGICYFYNVAMRDHNYKGGSPSTGYGKITLENALEASSNVGISKMIVEYYGKQPEKFVNKLYDMGLNEPLDLEIPGTACPNIRSPKDENAYWSGTTLPWMSIGYEVQVPPIYTLTFYNAIANGGEMIQPFFAKEIRRGNETIERFSTKTIRSNICSQRTLAQIQTALEGVVWNAHYSTARAARSQHVRIAGKTGTAQISNGLLGYKSGGKSHQVSFCGYFPIDAPRYTCLCVIRKPGPGHYPSGGTMCGSVVRNIAERTMAMKAIYETDDIVKDSTFHYTLPSIKRGPYTSVWTACNHMDIAIENAPRLRTQDYEWARLQAENDTLTVHPIQIPTQTVPRVIGMGARDAIYAIECTGMRTHVTGTGRVVRQSIPAGTTPIKGGTVYLELR